MSKTDDFFDKTDRMHPKRKAKRKGNEAYYTFRELIWRAIDEDDKDFSIVETAKALGLYK